MSRLRTLALPLALTLACAALTPRPALAAVSSEISFSNYTGNGATVAFPTGFRFLSNSDVVVKTKPLGSSIWTTLTLGVHYTLSGAGGTSGTVTMTVAPTGGTSIHIERDVLLTQTKSFRSAGTFSPGIHEDALDKLTMVAQQLSRQSSDVSASVATEAAARAAADAVLQNAIANIQVGVGGVAPVVATGSTTARTLSDRFAEVYNVKDYGALGDGVTDDTAAIQAAVDAAGNAGGGQVYVPAGIYVISSPVRVRNIGVRIVGASRDLCKFKSKAGTVGWLLIIGPEPTALPSVASLATGSGVAMVFSSANTDWINLTTDSEHTVSLDTRTAFTVEFFYKPTGPLAEIRTLVSASNRRTTDETAHESFALFANADGSMTVHVNIAGTVKACSTAAAALTAGVTKHIAVSYDNANIRLFVAGVQKCSVAATGGVQQPVLDDLIVGPYTWDYLDNSHIFAGPIGAIDSIHVSAYPFYTANFTPPTTKFSTTFATMALINFDDVHGMLLGGIAGLAGSSTAKYIWHSNSDSTTFGTGGGANSSVENIYFQGGGIFTRCSIGLRFSHLQFYQSPIGLALTNNSFLSTMEYIDAAGTGPTSVALIQTSASGVNTWTHVNVTASAYDIYARDGAIKLDHVFLASAGIAPLLLNGSGGSAMTADLDYVTMTDEADPGMETCMIVDSLVAFRASSTIFEAFINAVPNIKVSGDKPMFFDGSTFTTKTGAVQRIEFLSSRTVPVVVQEPTQWTGDLTIPWSSSQPSMVVLENQGSTSHARFISFDPQALTVADNGGGTAATATLTPTRSTIRVTCNDADGCNITLSESGALDGSFITITNVSANAVNFADTAGVSELTGAVALGQWDTLTLEYITDRWVERGLSNN